MNKELKKAIIENIGLTEEEYDKLLNDLQSPEANDSFGNDISHSVERLAFILKNLKRYIYHDDKLINSGVDNWSKYTVYDPEE